MDIFKTLEDLNANLKKLRDSIYENDVFEKATQKQIDTFYKMLKILLEKTNAYILEFGDKSHVMNTMTDLDKMQEIVNSDDITFYINTFEEKLDWYYANEAKQGGDFIAAADVVILWPLRAINERMYRYLFKQTFDTRFDNLFNQLEDKEEN